MYIVKHKLNFRILVGLMALLMLILPATVYGRGHRGGQGASADKQQAQAPAGQSVQVERTAPPVSMPQNIAAPQRGQDVTNIQGRGARSNTSRQSDGPMMKIDRPQPSMENRSIGANDRFNTGSNIKPPQAVSNDNKPMRENPGSGIWKRAAPIIEKRTPVGPAQVARTDNSIGAQNPPMPVAEKPSGKGFEKNGTFEKEHNNIGMMKKESNITGRDMRGSDNNNQRGAKTVDTHTATPPGVTPAASDTRNMQSRFSQWPRGDNKSTTIGRDNRDTWAQRATNWNHDRDRDNVTLRVVNNVPASVRAQRTSSFRDSSFFHHDDHHRFIDIPRNDFVFHGRHHRDFIHHRIVDRDFFFLAFFDFGPWHTFYPVYPYYHSRYIFVNPCGYWPYGYSYARYYWYGCYPYYWYGYNPVPYEYGGDNYNYYTYNYYGSDSTGPVTNSEIPNYTPQQPAPETSADQYFDDGVKAFGADDYKTAVAKFALANQAGQDDKVLPFAYSQAFFATGDYRAAAQVLRAAVAKVNPVTEGVFYPRGLYSSDDVLLKQIDALSDMANKNKQDTDLQFLLGYQYLGMGELDKAAEPLKSARFDSLNGPPANALLQLLDKLQTTQTQAQTQTQIQTPAQTQPKTRTITPDDID